MSVNSKSGWCPNRDSFKDRDIEEELRKHCAEGFATCNFCGRFIGLQTCKRSQKDGDYYFVKLYRHKLPEFLKTPKRTRKRKRQKYYGAGGLLLPEFEKEAEKK